MKKYITSLIIMLPMVGLQGLFAQESAIDKYFAKYRDNSQFTVVHIAPKMFELMAEITKENEDDFSDVLSNLRGLKILAADSIKDGMALFNDASEKLVKKSFEELMYIHKENETELRFYVQEKNKKIRELLLLVGEPNEFVMISFVGDIDLKKIGKLSKSLDINGFNHLDQLNNE
ncbi:MAG: DUF4252 domain-containing protein [Cytophagales bacterium]|nr:DUF4252 domain-containing protein [Cytophagales bacterium]